MLPKSYRIKRLSRISDGSAVPFDADDRKFTDKLSSLRAEAYELEIEH